MRQPNRKPAEPDAHDVAAYLAASAVRTALASTFRKKQKCFVITLLVPDTRFLIDYSTAAERLLEEYRTKEGFEDYRHNAVALGDPKTPVRMTDLDFDRVIVVTDEDCFDDALDIASDRVITLRAARLSDVKKAMKSLFGTTIIEADARLLADADWRDLRLAFRPGREVEQALARLRRRRTRANRHVAGAVDPQQSKSLEDMHGYGDAATWGRRLARDLSDWKAGIIRWKDVDKGILLAGPPGVGKTVFARALANSCQTELVLASMAKWQAAGYLNDLLKSMRKSFDEARKKAPAILFVDELDAIGSRATARGDNASYHQQVINCFLEQLDGAEAREGVVVVGATNRPWEIDEAILRPGRLEAVVEIPLPDLEARLGILAWHSGLNAPPTSMFAMETNGWTGADIELLVRHARRQARETRTKLSVELIESLLPPTEVLPHGVLWRIAVHECGHALMGHWLGVGEFRGVHLNKSVRVNAGRVSAGHALFETRARLRTRQSYLDRIAFILGGIAAETVLFGEFADGSGGAPTSDLCKATSVASEVVAALGMDEFLVAEDSLNNNALARARSNPRVWNRVDHLLHQELDRAIALLTIHRELLVDCAEQVLANGTLTANDMETLCRRHPPVGQPTTQARTLTIKRRAPE